MLFRSSEGKYIEINRKDYIDDKSYYGAIMSLQTDISESSSEDPLDQILEICQKKKEKNTYRASRRRSNEKR